MSVRERGFTLIEVLVALGILGLLGLAFVRIFSSTFDATSNITARNDLLHEAQIAQQLIASKVKLAWYVYPTGTTIKINNGATTANALAGSNTWTVGSDPFLALVLPPQDPTQNCTPTDKDGCYRFYAYYAFPRSHYLSAISASSSQRLDPDPRNDNTWVIMEYRTALTAFTPNPSCSNIPTPNGGLPGGGRLLVEYVQPESDTPSYTIFAVQPDNSVVLSLRMVKDTVKRTIRLPAPSGTPLELKTTPRNYRVGCN